jgi:hypothetical protein
VGFALNEYAMRYILDHMAVANESGPILCWRTMRYRTEGVRNGLEGMSGGIELCTIARYYSFHRRKSSIRSLSAFAVRVANGDALVHCAKLTVNGTY